MDDGALALEQLDALSRAVPEEQELQELHAFLQARRRPRPCQPPGAAVAASLGTVCEECWARGVAHDSPLLRGTHARCFTASCMPRDLQPRAFTGADVHSLAFASNDLT